MNRGEAIASPEVICLRAYYTHKIPTRRILRHLNRLSHRQWDSVGNAVARDNDCAACYNGRLLRAVNATRVYKIYAPIVMGLCVDTTPKGRQVN